VEHGNQEIAATEEEPKAIAAAVKESSDNEEYKKEQVHQAEEDMQWVTMNTIKAASEILARIECCRDLRHGFQDLLCAAL